MQGSRTRDADVVPPAERGGPPPRLDRTPHFYEGFAPFVLAGALLNEARMTHTTCPFSLSALLSLALVGCSVLPAVEVEDASFLGLDATHIEANDASVASEDAFVLASDTGVTPPDATTRDAQVDAAPGDAGDAGDAPASAEPAVVRARGMAVSLSSFSCATSAYVVRAEASRPLAEVVSYFGDESVGDVRIVSSRVFEITLADYERSYVTGGAYLRVGIVPAGDSPPYTLALTFAEGGARITDASLMRASPAIARDFARELRAKLIDLYERDGTIIEASGGADYWTARGNVSMELVHEVVDDPSDLRTFEGSGYRVLLHPDVVWPGSSHDWVGIYDENEAALVSLERR